LRVGLGRLKTDRARLANRLRFAHTQSGEGSTAAQLSAAYAGAARALTKLDPPPDASGVHAAVTAALRQAAAAYGRMAASASARDRGQWNYWRQRVQRDETNVVRAVEGLKPLGYKLGRA
jgi:hypothetical protein